MLLIQHIKLHWNKDCRGAPHSVTRSQMPKSHELPQTFFDYNPLGYPSHYMYLIQRKNGLDKKINRIDTLTDHENERIGATEILKQGINYEIRYRYDFHGYAIPERHKYDPHECVYKPLNESAMVLKENEYGRIIYNGRYRDYDTGQWYYEMDIVNVIYISKDKVSLNIFTDNEPDRTYKQIAFLR
jgi:hypothetical protein